jgi:uroporphyrinogen-III synthase
MPSKPVLIMTRPQAQARRFVADCAARLGWAPTVIDAPVIEIVALDTGAESAEYAGVILTSANGAELAPDYSGKRLYCVGKSTAAAARARGGMIFLSAENADDLVAQITAKPPQCPLIHFRGEHARGYIAKRLCSAGIETHEAAVYAQHALDLPPAAIVAMAGEAPAVLPLFSPRSADLVGRAVDRIGRGLSVIALSPAVALAWKERTGGTAELCDRPTGEEMLSRCVAALSGTSA